MSTYIRKAVLKPAGKSPGAAAPKDPNVAIIAVDDILQWPMRDGKGVKHTGNFVLKPNAEIMYLYMTPSKIKASFESEGDEDAVSFKQKFEGEHPGNELEIAEFVQNNTGVNVIIIYGSCSDNYRKVLGTKCAPLQLKPSLQDDNEARKHMLVFEQMAKSGYVPGHYTGTLEIANPFTVTSVSTVTLNEANGLIYKLPSLDTTAAITFADINLPAGQIITLIGSGGGDPAVLTSSRTDKSALLKDGTPWVALEGSVINLQVFDAGSTNILIELSRS